MFNIYLVNDEFDKIEKLFSGDPEIGIELLGPNFDVGEKINYHGVPKRIHKVAMNFEEKKTDVVLCPIEYNKEKAEKISKLYKAIGT